MTAIIYGDMLREAGIAVDWRAVEHDRALPAAGLPSGSDQASRGRELAEVASLALPGEQVPAGPPTLVSNSGAAVSAYAEAVSDGVADELRGSLFRVIWAQGLNLSSPHEVRRLVTDLMWPREDVGVRLAGPDFPSLLLRDTDMTRIVRRSGGTAALNGVPLTTAGWRRVRQWRQEWLALPSQVIPPSSVLTRSFTLAPQDCATWPGSPAPHPAGPSGTRRKSGRPDQAVGRAPEGRLVRPGTPRRSAGPWPGRPGRSGRARPQEQGPA